MSATDVPPGWHPDPADPASSYRWWDGTRWTEHTRQPGPIPAHGQWDLDSSGWVNNPGVAEWQQHPQAPQNPGYGTEFVVAPAPSLGQRNKASFTAVGVAALYVLIAVTTHVVLLGVVPAVAAVRAFRRREPLAPLAATAAVVAIVVAVTSLTR